MDIENNPAGRVAEAVAVREGVDPTALGEPIWNTIDPDALDEVSTEPTVEVSFRYHGYEVTVHDEERILVSEAPRN